jgi:hypothetical protein
MINGRPVMAAGLVTALLLSPGQQHGSGDAGVSSNDRALITVRRWDCDLVEHVQPAAGASGPWLQEPSGTR